MFSSKPTSDASKAHIEKYKALAKGFIVVPANQIVDFRSGMFDFEWSMKTTALDEILKGTIKVYTSYAEAYQAYHAQNQKDNPSTIAFIDPATCPVAIVKSYLYIGNNKQPEIRITGFMGRQYYPESYNKLTGAFDMAPNATNNAPKVAALFKEYVKTGTGWRRFIYFHTSRTRAEIAAAKAIIDVLDKNLKLTNEAILLILSNVYNMHQSTIAERIKPNSGLDNRLSFVVSQLSHGEFKTITKYNWSLKLNTRPQQKV